MNQSIGFVGVGRMGANMARHLKDQSYKITAVYDVYRKSAENLASELGCKAPATLADVTRLADIILTVVTDDKAMRGIFFSDEDNLLMDSKGKLFINCATLTPNVHREVEKAARAAGAESLEACMASSITQAREGTLYLMIGGDRKVFDRTKDLLQSLSAKLRYVGPSGAAAEVKAIVNMVMNCNTAALAEGLGLGHALGQDLKLLREVLSQTGANSRVLETDGEDMQIRDHECYFSSAHAAKDSRIASGLADDVGINLPVNKATLAQYDKMVAMNLGHLDKSGIAEIVFKDRQGGA